DLLIRAHRDTVWARDVFGNDFRALPIGKDVPHVRLLRLREINSALLVDDDVVRLHETWRLSVDERRFSAFGIDDVDPLFARRIVVGHQSTLRVEAETARLDVFEERRAFAVFVDA